MRTCMLMCSSLLSRGLLIIAVCVVYLLQQCTQVLFGTWFAVLTPFPLHLLLLCCQDTSTHHTLYFTAQYQVLDNNSFTEENTQDNSAEVYTTHHAYLILSSYMVITVSLPALPSVHPQMSLSLINPSVVGASVSVPTWVVAVVSVVAILLALVGIGVTFAILTAVSLFVEWSLLVSVV